MTDVSRLDQIKGKMLPPAVDHWERMLEGTLRAGFESGIFVLDGDSKALYEELRQKLGIGTLCHKLRGLLESDPSLSPPEMLHRLHRYPA